MFHTNPAAQESFVFCFSDIVDSTDLWEADSTAMSIALSRHNDIFRYHLPRFGGHEVKGLGDGFFLSFPHPSKALNFGLTILRAMRDEIWDDAIVTFRKEKDINNGLVRQGSKSTGRGLVLRLGMHYGVPDSEEVHPESGRVDYYGRVVNIASRIENKAHPEEMTVSDAFIAALYTQLTRVQIPFEALDDALRRKILCTQILGHQFDVIIKGEKKLKGIEKCEYITAVRLRR